MRLLVISLIGIINIYIYRIDNVGISQGGLSKVWNTLEFQNFNLTFLCYLLEFTVSFAVLLQINNDSIVLLLFKI